MKKLYVVRHAKSSWDFPGLTDFQRPLNQRGEKDAPRMGKRLQNEKVNPGLICSSPAVRALSTAKVIAGALGYPAGTIQEERTLYHASEETILEVIQRFRADVQEAMIVGHNPGLTDFVNALLDEDISNIPTTGVVACILQVDAWADAAWGCGKLLFFDYPKKGH
ncbi:MAG: histidine phosphatase family protein [Cytophagales bacterium]|nr:histidine phosphatase family protein [Cytophagales bacterium]